MWFRNEKIPSIKLSSDRCHKYSWIRICTYYIVKWWSTEVLKLVESLSLVRLSIIRIYNQRNFRPWNLWNRRNVGDEWFLIKALTFDKHMTKLWNSHWHPTRPLPFHQTRYFVSLSSLKCQLIVQSPYLIVVSFHVTTHLKTKQASKLARSSSLFSIHLIIHQKMYFGEEYGLYIRIYGVSPTVLLHTYLPPYNIPSFDNLSD